MEFPDFSQKESFIHKIDPRVRLLTCVLFSAFLAAGSNILMLCSVLCLSIIILSMSGISLKEIRGRLLAVNLFISILFVTVPLKFNLEKAASCISYSFSDLDLCWKILLRCNCIMLLVTALVMTMDSVTLGHAMNHLLIPEKLSNLFLFSIRYIDVIHKEYLCMKRAAIARGFKAGMNFHTCKTFASFASMLLVRAIDKSERIMDAMKCRCFTGKFYMENHFSFRKIDLFFSLTASIILAIMLYLEFYL